MKYVTYSISNTKNNDSPVKLVQMHIGSSCTDTAIWTYKKMRQRNNKENVNPVGHLKLSTILNFTLLCTHNRWILFTHSTPPLQLFIAIINVTRNFESCHFSSLRLEILKVVIFRVSAFLISARVDMWTPHIHPCGYWRRLPHKVKTQYLRFRSHAEYFLLSCETYSCSD